MAVRELSDSLATGTSVYASDDDPELVADALPFALKLNESLLLEDPRHRGLLLSACSGFTQYSYAFVEEPADESESADLAAATTMRRRACRLYIRARDYGIRGLELAQPGFGQIVHQNALRAAAPFTKSDVPLLYWTAASWGKVVALSKDQPERVADQPIVEALIDRALQLDESFDDGAIHTFLISYEMARQGGATDPATRARRHFERAMELSHGQSAAPLVAYAESVCIAAQDRAEFLKRLNQALAIDPDRHPQTRLANLIAQRRARWLASRVDELFVE